MSEMIDVYFYLNEGDFNRVKDLESIEEFTLHHPQLVWSWGTYFRMKQAGFPVTLINKLPESGIVIIPAIYLAMFQKPPAKVLLICTVADTPPPIFMQVNLTQNPVQKWQYPNLFRFPVWYHVPHWPQPNIIPRDQNRGDRFENVAFFGHDDQLDPQLQSKAFLEDLQAIGLRFAIVEKDFNDFSEVDAVLAIRVFSNELLPHKPYTKLVNAWTAGVPAIVGPESAYQSIRKSELDFLCVKNYGELISALKQLKLDKRFREAMVRNGWERKREYTDESIIKVWAQLLFTDAQSYYQEWVRRSSIGRQIFYTDLFLSRALRSAKNKFQKRFRFATN